MFRVLRLLELDMCCAGNQGIDQPPSCRHCGINSSLQGCRDESAGRLHLCTKSFCIPAQEKPRAHPFQTTAHFVRRSILIRWLYEKSSILDKDVGALFDKGCFYDSC
eukprot:4018113-Amphidinium_carterae.2